MGFFVHEDHGCEAASTNAAHGLEGELSVRGRLAGFTFRPASSASMILALFLT